MLKKSVNKTIYNVTKNLENFQYNVVIANMHEIYNIFNQHVVENKTSSKILKSEWEKIIMLLMPLVPHLAHECCENFKKESYWPMHDSKLLLQENSDIVIQIDGKKRGILTMPTNSEEKLIVEKSKKVKKIVKYIENKKIIKNIYIKNKLINFITKK